MSKKNQKRSLKETETVEIVQEDEEKITISKKKTTTMSRTTTKGQSSLSGFFGVTHNPSAKFHGDAKHEDFKSDQLNIWVWNINGLQAVINKGMLDVFLQGEDPDIVCFNEIKTDPEKIKSASFHTKIPKDYEQYWNCSKSKKGYSGTGLITKIKPIKVTFDIGIEEHDQEGRVITAEFSKFVLVAVYVPNSGDDLRRLSYRTQEWDKAFFDYLDRTRIETNKPLILTGDLNVARNELDVFDTKGKDKVACYTPEERKSFESFINRGYIDTFRHLYPDKREYTYFSARFNNKVTNKGWRIDYFVVHQDDINMVTDVTIHKDYNGSDHVPVCLHLDLSKIKKEEEEVKGVSKVKSKVRGKTPTKASKSKSRSKSKSERKEKDDETESEKEDDQEESKETFTQKKVINSDEKVLSNLKSKSKEATEQPREDSEEESESLIEVQRKKLTSNKSKDSKTTAMTAFKIPEAVFTNNPFSTNDLMNALPSRSTFKDSTYPAQMTLPQKRQSNNTMMEMMTEVNKRYHQRMAEYAGQTLSTADQMRIKQEITMQVKRELDARKSNHDSSESGVVEQKPKWDQEYQQFDEEF
eukprot:403335404